jgi:hypothetical protein
MTDNRASFAEAAERFDRIVQKVKAEQFARTGVKNPPCAPEPAAAHPQETWERNYATHAVRPGRPLGAPPRLWGVSRPEEPPAAPPRPPQAALSGPIGLAIGKPARKRSWVRRLFRGG